MKTMQTYWLTIIYYKDGATSDMQKTEKVRAESEHLARRNLLGRYLKQGYLVRSIIADTV